MLLHKLFEGHADKVHALALCSLPALGIKKTLIKFTALVADKMQHTLQSTDTTAAVP